MNECISHVRKVKCRVCRKELKYKNYKDHLRKVHDDEDENNLTEASDQPITSFFHTRGPNPKRSRTDTDGTGGGQVSRHSPALSPPRAGGSPRCSPPRRGVSPSPRCSPPRRGVSPRRSSTPSLLSDSDEDEKIAKCGRFDSKEDEEISDADDPGEVFKDDKEPRRRYYSGESGVCSGDEDEEENELNLIIQEQHNILRRLERFKSRKKNSKRQTSVKTTGPRQHGLLSGREQEDPAGGRRGGGPQVDLPQSGDVVRQSGGQVHLPAAAGGDRGGGQGHGAQADRPQSGSGEELGRQSGGQVHLLTQPGGASAPRLADQPEVGPGGGDKIHEVLLVSAKSLQEIKNLGYLLFSEEMMMKCPLCPETKFKFDEKCFEDFNDKDKQQPPAFRSLKKSLKRHLNSIQHKINSNVQNQNKEESEKIYSLNMKAGMICGRVAYHNLRRGRPVRDYEEDLLILKLSGAQIGQC